MKNTRRINFIAACAAAALLAVAAFLAVPALSRRGEVGSAAPVYASPAVTYSALPEELGGLFTDYTQTALSGEYDEMSELKAFEEEISKGTGYAAAPDLYRKFFDRAEEIVKGNVFFNGGYAFSTLGGETRQIEQYGDIGDYSTRALKWGFAGCDLMPTGISAGCGDEITVYVEATAGANLPTMVLLQNRASLDYYRSADIKLRAGLNTFVFPQMGTSQSGVQGGTLYLKNPYIAGNTDSNPYYGKAQRGDVSLYIEGGYNHPIFAKGGDETQFLGYLKEYEETREELGRLDFAELETDNALISTTSSSLYVTYVENSGKTISPTENLDLWGEYMRANLEFNGIATTADSPYARYFDELNTHVRINFRNMASLGGAAAYTYSHIISYYDQNYWFANFYDFIDTVHYEDGKKRPINTREIFDLSHEIGHMLDTQGRIYSETTNNMNATYVFLRVAGQRVSSWQPYSKSLEKLSSDYALDYTGYKDGGILYTGGTHNGYTDHNYMVWWYLETMFPGYWGRLANFYRYDNFATALKQGYYDNQTTEKMVLYSSIATGVDLRDYFERWGVYLNAGGSTVPEREYAFKKNSASSAFNSYFNAAIADGRIAENVFTPYWIADYEEFDFVREQGYNAGEEKPYAGKTPEIAEVRKSGASHTVLIGASDDPDFYGYFVLSAPAEEGDYRLAGFTRAAYFDDVYDYGADRDFDALSGDPYYKVIAVNRHFGKSAESAPVRGGASAQNKGVCRIGENYYASLNEAFDTIDYNDPDVTTVYLIDNAVLDGSSGSFYFAKNARVEVDPDVRRDIVLTSAGGNARALSVQSPGVCQFVGRPDARIIFDGKGESRFPYMLQIVSCTSLLFENVTFKDIYSSSTAFASALYCSAVPECTLKDCVFENCSSAAADKGAVEFTSPDTRLTLDGVVFENCGISVYMACLRLAFRGGVRETSLAFGSLADDGYCLTCEGFSPSADDLKLITFAQNYAISSDGGRLKVSVLDFTLTFISGGAEYTCKAVGKKTFTFGEEDTDIPENKYISQYRERDTGLMHLPGERIDLVRDMTFEVELKDKLKMTFELFEGETSLYVLPGTDVYLPARDGADREIRQWSQGGNIYPAGGIVRAPQEDLVFTADYAGYFRYSLSNGGKLLKKSYAAYGEKVTLPDEADLQAVLFWIADGERSLPPGEAEITANAAFEAVLSDRVYDLMQAEIEIIGAPFSYTGSEIRPGVKVTIGGKEISPYYYDLTYSSNTDCGTAEVTVLPKSAKLATGSKSANFTITARTLALSDVRVSGLEDRAYTGSEIRLSPALAYGQKKLGEGTDYSLSYSDDLINSGKVTVTVAFSGNFAGEIELVYSILKAARENISVRMADRTYGEEGEPPAIVGINRENGDVTFEYSRYPVGGYFEAPPSAAGTYYVRALIGETRNYLSYTTPASAFTIQKAAIAERPAAETEVPYTAEKLSSVPLPAGWTWDEPERTLITGANYCGATYRDAENYLSPTATVKVVRMEKPKTDISSCTAESIPAHTYTGKAIEPEPEVRDGGELLVKGRDYTLSYSDNISCGTAHVTVAGINGYFGTLVLAFAIEKAPAPFDLPESLEVSRHTERIGDAQPPAGWRWKDPSTPFEEEREYVLEYTAEDRDNFAVTECSVTVGYIPLTDISQCATSGVEESYPFTGGEITPLPVVTCGGKTLAEGRDYTLSYSDNVSEGEGKITVSGIGDYCGEISIVFAIVRERPQNKLPAAAIAAISLGGGAALAAAACACIWAVKRRRGR